MNRTRGTSGTSDPWRVRVGVAQIPDTGLHSEFEADQPTRAALAAIGGVREILSAKASFDVMPGRDGRFHVEGRVQARIGQTCVVSLDPIESVIDEPIDLIFAPPEQIPVLSDLVDDAAESAADIGDPPEPIENGAIDLGRVATDALYLAIDPYPRRPDAVFEPPGEVIDPADHPFAALKALQADPPPHGRKKLAKKLPKKHPKTSGPG